MRTRREVEGLLLSFVGVASLATVLAACQGPAPEPTRDEATSKALAEYRARPSSPLAAGEAAGFHGVKGGFEAHFRAAPPAPAQVILPERASGVARIKDIGTGMSVEVSLRGATPEAARTTDGYLVYRGGHASGATLLHRALPTGVEDYLAFDTRPAAPSVSYDLSLTNGVAGLRLVGGSLELLDASGTPRLRAAPPYIVGADGLQTDARLAVEGCAVDTNPAGPWGRAPTAPGASSCRVVVSWTDEAVRYPAILDPRWTTTGSLSVPRQDYALILLPLTGKVLAAGGRSSPTGTTGLSSAELYDRNTQTWAATNPMTGGRWGASATLLRSSTNATTSQKVLIAGGINGTASVNTAQLYSQTAGTWVAAGNLNAARHFHSATLLADGRVLVAGGMNGTATLQTAALYNPAAGGGSWAATTGPIPPPGLRFHVASLITTSNSQLNNKVLLAGGNNGTSTISSVFLFDPAQSAFSTLASMPSPREGHTAVTLPDGRILFAGGKNGSSTLASAVIFNPALGPGSWSTTGSMTSPRWGHTMTLLPTGVLTTGQVLVAGGSSNGTDTLASTEIWNGTSWAASAAMVAPVKQHAAVSLGKLVLVAGGVNGSSTVGAAELDDPSNGLACTASTDCASGFCANGVCCDTACNEGCGSCNLPGSVGVCSPVANGTTCRAAAGVCDVPAVCSGSSVVCPPNPFLPATTVCRPAPGGCDVAENCTGSSAACPPDVLSSSGAVCRPQAGECDVPEVCSGTSAACPPDDKRVAGTACGDDGNGCTNDRCDGINNACGHPNACSGAQTCFMNACCMPATCASAGRECGSASDGCGGTLSCGGCTSSSHCTVAGQCVPDPSAGDVPTGVNICRILLEDLTVFIPTPSCHSCGAECIFLPQCFAPGACLADPSCFFLEFIDQVEQIISAGSVYCSVDLSAEGFLEALIGGRIQNMSEILASGLPLGFDNLYTIYLQILTAKGQNIPANAQAIVADLVSPIYDGGVTGFAFDDMTQVKVVSSDFPTASFFLPTGRPAITLGPVIVMRADVYNVLFDPANAGATTNQVLNMAVSTTCCNLGFIPCHANDPTCVQNSYYRNAIDILTHELVHVKQYRVLGQEGFLLSYALSTIAFWATNHAESTNPFENEAYSYESQISELVDGNYCLAEKPVQDAALSDYGEGPVVCM
jgi:hypothetical protein